MRPIGQNFFLDSLYMSTEVDAATKHAALAAMKNYQPCHAGKKGRVSIYSPWAKRRVKVDPYSRAAKKLYRFYIQEPTTTRRGSRPPTWPSTQTAAASRGSPGPPR